MTTWQHLGLFLAYSLTGGLWGWTLCYEWARHREKMKELDNQRERDAAEHLRLMACLDVEHEQRMAAMGVVPLRSTRSRSSQNNPTVPTKGPLPSRPGPGSG